MSNSIKTNTLFLSNPRNGHSSLKPINLHGAPILSVVFCAWLEASVKKKEQLLASPKFLATPAGEGSGRGTGRLKNQRETVYQQCTHCFFLLIMARKE